MTIPIQFPTLGSGQGVTTGTGAPDPYQQLVTAILQGAQLGQAANEERGRNSRSSEALALEQKKLDLILADKKTEQIRAKTEGEALLQVLPVLIQGGALNGMMGQQGQQMAPQAPQGAPGPSGMPGIGVTPSVPVRGGQGPQARFNEIVAGLPPEFVGGFVAKYGSMVQEQQAKLDQEAAFDEAQTLTQGLLTPEQDQGLRVARALFQAGAPKEMYESMLPKGQIELAKSVTEVKGMKSEREADRAATPKLVQYGLAAANPGGVGTEYVIKGAAKMLYDYVADVRKDARTAAREQTKQRMDAAVKGLEGSALDLAQLNPDWNGSQIKAALKQMPEYANLPDGVVSLAAREAPKKSRELTAPRNADEARTRGLYKPAQAALAVVNTLAKKGVALNWKSDLAQVDMKTTGTAGGGLGAAAGFFLGGPPGAVVGGAAGSGAGVALAKPVQKLGRALMSKDEERFFTSASVIANAALRLETGATASAPEIRDVTERYIDLRSDSPETRALKRQLRDDLDAALANVSGLDREVAQPILDAVLSQHEQVLLQSGVPLSRGIVTHAPLTPGRGTGRSF